MITEQRKGIEMTRKWKLYLWVAAWCVGYFAACQLCPAADFTAWSLMNSDVVTARFGLAEGNFEAGASLGYLDDLRPADVEAYRVGLYGLYTANPDGNLPVRSWIPGRPEWLPETVPVLFYVGGLLDLEFQDHKLMPALVGGAAIKTGTHGSLGVEFSQTFNAGDWDHLADGAEGWAAVVFLRWRFGPVN